MRGIRNKTRKGKLSLGYKGFLCRPNQKTQFMKAQGPVEVGKKGCVARLQAYLLLRCRSG